MNIKKFHQSHTFVLSNASILVFCILGSVSLPGVALFLVIEGFLGFVIWSIATIDFNLIKNKNTRKKFLDDIWLSLMLALVPLVFGFSFVLVASHIDGSINPHTEFISLKTVLIACMYTILFMASRFIVLWFGQTRTNPDQSPPPILKEVALGYEPQFFVVIFAFGYFLLLAFLLSVNNGFNIVYQNWMGLLLLITALAPILAFKTKLEIRSYKKVLKKNHGK